MGRCCNCGKQINLKDGNSKCPNCGQDAYKCWNCHQTISARNECSACGYYTCEHCGLCSDDCPLNWFPFRIHEECPEISEELAKKVLQIYFSLRNNNYSNRYVCPQGVPVSYARQRLRNFVIKLISGKDAEETAMFRKRVTEIAKEPIGYKFTISKKKEKGFYGQEVRDAAFYCICKGILKVSRIEIKNDDNEITGYYDEFERIAEPECKLQNYDKIVVKICPSCNNHFDITPTYCPNKCVYLKGKRKGEQVKLKRLKSNCHYCQLSKHCFIKKKEYVNGSVKSV